MIFSQKLAIIQGWFTKFSPWAYLQATASTLPLLLLHCCCSWVWICGVYACVHVQLHGSCVYVETKGHLTSDILFYHSFPHSFDIGTLTEPWTRLAARHPPVSVLLFSVPSAGLQAWSQSFQAIYMDAGIKSSGLHGKCFCPLSHLFSPSPVVLKGNLEVVFLEDKDRNLVHRLVVI